MVVAFKSKYATLGHTGIHDTIEVAHQSIGFAVGADKVLLG